MIKKYASNKSLEELSNYLDTLVRYVFYKLKKSRYKHDTIYYPAYYLYKENMNELKDNHHLDEAYDRVTITIRKVTNSSSVIIVKLENISKNDWQYDMLYNTYKKAIEVIEKSKDSFNYTRKGY